MALRALMLRRSMEAKKRELQDLLAKDDAFTTRETELEGAINEVENEEQEQAVSAEVEQFETDKKAHEALKETLSADIEKLEADLAAIEANEPAPPAQRGGCKKPERIDVKMNEINIRSLPKNVRAFDALPMERRQAIVAQEDVKTFLQRFRELGQQQRAVSGGELTIPVVFLDLISENMYRYSKLLNRVRVRNVNGEARQTIAGIAPEAVWTEMCAAINELTFVFNQITVDGFKVAGYIPVCNSLLEDSDVALASWIVEMLSESLGLAKDKSILYGKGATAHMPMGIVTRLAQSSKPADYPANAPAWEDLSTTNILKIGGDGVTGAEFWAALMEATGNTYTKYSRGNQFWAMNSKTYAKLKSKVITFTATGDIVSNVFGTLPIINGDIDILEFMPDGDIVGGYGDLYLWAQRSGMQIDLSREVQFIQDNTVFRGKERADGQPIIPGAFVAININNQAVTTAMDFAADTANDAQLSELSLGAALTPAFGPEKYSYTLTTTGATAKIEATPAQAGAQVEISVNGKNARNGATVTWSSGANTVAVTVTQGNAVRVYNVAVTKSGS
nr:MAG TPA: major capsid protein [Caudoviricetes sp.]